jgi:hypothetical protein
MKDEAKKMDEECCGFVSNREANVPRREDKPKPPCRQQKDGDK